MDLVSAALGGEEEEERILHVFNVLLEFTMAAVMVVRIFEPSIELKGEFVLKTYDHHYNDEIRDQHDVPYWDLRRDVEVEKPR